MSKKKVVKKEDEHLPVCLFFIMLPFTMVGFMYLFISLISWVSDVKSTVNMYPSLENRVEKLETTGRHSYVMSMSYPERWTVEKDGSSRNHVEEIEQ